MDTSSVVSFVIIGIILILASAVGYYFVKNGELTRKNQLLESLIESQQMPVLDPKLSQKFYWINGEYKLVKSIKIKKKTKPTQLQVNLQGKDQLVFLN